MQRWHVYFNWNICQGLFLQLDELERSSRELLSLWQGQVNLARCIQSVEHRTATVRVEVGKRGRHLLVQKLAFQIPEIPLGCLVHVLKFAS